MEVLMGLALGAGALLFARRGRAVVRSAVGWTARRSGWVATRVQSSIERTRALAREEYERGRRDAIARVAHEERRAMNGHAPIQGEEIDTTHHEAV
jgi:hypothetical protein